MTILQEAPAGVISQVHRLRQKVGGGAGPRATGKGRFRRSRISVSGLMPRAAKMVAARSSGRTKPRVE
jgi:hypothetical protein